MLLKQRRHVCLRAPRLPTLVSWKCVGRLRYTQRLLCCAVLCCVAVRLRNSQRLLRCAVLCCTTVRLRNTQRLLRCAVLCCITVRLDRRICLQAVTGFCCCCC
jgi:hypothetical protein